MLKGIFDVKHSRHTPFPTATTLYEIIFVIPTHSFRMPRSRFLMYQNFYVILPVISFELASNVTYVYIHFPDATHNRRAAKPPNRPILMARHTHIQM